MAMLFTMTFFALTCLSCDHFEAASPYTGINYQDQDTRSSETEVEIRKTERLLQEIQEKAKSLRDGIVGAPNRIGLDNSAKWDQLKDLLEDELALIEKLISLNPSNPKYKYEMALLAFRQNSPEQGLSLLEEIAPYGEVGYAEGHKFLAQYNLQKKYNSAEQRKQYIQKAEQQISSCLAVDGSNVDAKKIKAYILDEKEDFLGAYKIYKEVFETDPDSYRDLMRLAGLIGKESEKESIVKSASNRFRKLAGRSTDNVPEWELAWQQYCSVMTLNRDLESYAQATTVLEGEVQKFVNDVEKRTILKKLLSRIYSERAISRGRSDEIEVMKLQLSDLKKAFENDDENDSAKQWLTILDGKPEIGEEAREVYDHRRDPNASWVVLSEIGNQSLKNKDYENAVRYFELVKIKQPHSPQALNNLAYAYLVSDNSNAEQALQLVDQAIAYQINRPNKDKNHQIIMSSFFDTRGVALMQLDLSLIHI